MKTTNLFSGIVALAAISLTACSNELPNSGPEVFEKDDVRYVSISITNPPATRADKEFENGEGDENTVKDAFFIFYDEYGRVIGDNNVVNLTLTDPATSNGSAGQIASTVVELQIPRGSNPPAYVMAFLNPVNYSEVSSKNNIEDLRNQIRESYLCSHNLFAMNNSAYYGHNYITGADNVKILGAPVFDKNLYPTRDAAEKADAEGVIDIYVERYAAKVRFELNQAGIKDQTVGTGNNTYTLAFAPQFWTVNADAPNMYASKRFENSNSNDHEVPSLTDVNDMLEGWTTWNDPINHRSYWACSPGYYATDFPAVSDEIIDQVQDGTGAGKVVGNFALKYYSYNQITNQDPEIKVGKEVLVGNTASNYKYVLENTMGKEAFNSPNPKAAAPSLVIVGRYKLKKGNTEIDYTTNNCHGFCLYAEGLHYIDNAPENDPNASTIKKFMMDRNGILAVDQNGTLMTSAVSEELLNCFEVKHPSKDVRHGQKVPHRYVTLQLKDGLKPADLQGLYYQPAGSTNWSPITKTATETFEEIVTGINSLLWAQIGNAQAFKDGDGYFSIPIQHLGITENTSESPYVTTTITNPDNTTTTTTVLDWKKVRVGDFGLVRNHVYSIKVSAIEGLASGIEDPDNPLVPSMETDDYWVKYKINILNWRVVPAQIGIILK